MKHVVMYSGGKASFLAAHRVKETYPGEDIQLLFTDTKTEDEDLYRFLEETATALDLPLSRSQTDATFGKCSNKTVSLATTGCPCVHAF